MSAGAKAPAAKQAPAHGPETGEITPDRSAVGEEEASVKPTGRQPDPSQFRALFDMILNDLADSGAEIVERL